MEDQNVNPSEDEKVTNPEGSTVVEAVAKKPEGEVEKGEETPKVYLEAEVEAREAQLKQEWDTKRQEHETKHKSELDKLQTDYGEALTQLRAQEVSTFLKGVEEAGGDVDMAKRLAGMETNLREKERTIQQQEASNLAGLKAIDAHRLSTQYGVDENKLMEANNPVEMENIALKLHSEKLKAEQEKLQSEAEEAKKAPQVIDSSTPIGGNANWEAVRAAYIKNPSNPAIRERYMEMRKERNAQK